MVGISILTHSHVELLEKNTLKPMNAKKSFSHCPPLPCTLVFANDFGQMWT